MDHRDAPVDDLASEFSPFPTPGQTESFSRVPKRYCRVATNRSAPSRSGSALKWVRGDKLSAVHTFDPLFREIASALRARLRRLRCLASVELSILKIDGRNLPKDLLIIQL